METRTLSVHLIEDILNYLAAQPFKEVAMLINKVQQELQTQTINLKKQANTSPPKPDPEILQSTSD